MNKISTEEVAEQAAKRLRAAVEALGSELAPVRYGSVATKAGLHLSVLSELCNGKRVISSAYAAKLAPVLGVSVGYLLGMEELPADAGEEGAA